MKTAVLANSASEKLLNSLENKSYKERMIAQLNNSKGTWVNLWNYPKNLNQFIHRLQKFISILFIYK